MRTSHYFLIESDRARHELVLDGDLIASFPTFEAAEAEVKRIANHAAPGVSLQFGLDMKSTPEGPRSTLITLQRISLRGTRCRNSYTSAMGITEITPPEIDHIIHRSYRECPGGPLAGQRPSLQLHAGRHS